MNQKKQRIKEELREAYLDQLNQQYRKIEIMKKQLEIIKHEARYWEKMYDDKRKLRKQFLTELNTMEEKYDNAKKIISEQRREIAELAIKLIEKEQEIQTIKEEQKQ